MIRTILQYKSFERRLFSTKTMSAMIIDKPKESLKLKKIVIPKPNKNQVRLKVNNCGVCYRDIIDRRGGFPFIQPDVVTGHEIAGIVEEKGSNVGDHLNVGDRVVTLHWSPCNQCEPCKNGRSTVCERRAESFLGLTANGGYAESLVVGESACVPIPENWSMTEASTVMCTYGTVWHSLFQRGGLARGETLLVTGSGGVASAAVQMARAIDCHVIGVTSQESKVEHLTRLGASDVVVLSDASQLNRHAVVQARRPDVVLEAVGEPYFNASLRSLKPSGRLVLIGNVTNGMANFKLGLAILNELSIIGGDSITRQELLDCFDFLDKHKIRPHVDQTLPLHQANEAQQLLIDGKAKGRIVLDCDAQ